MDLFDIAASEDPAKKPKPRPMPRQLDLIEDLIRPNDLFMAECMAVAMQATYNAMDRGEVQP